MKKVIATMIGIAFAFCCFMLYEGRSTDTNVTEESANDMYYPSNLELIEVSIENSYPGVDYDEMIVVATPEENDGYLTYALIEGGHVVGFESVSYEYGAQAYFN